MFGSRDIGNRPDVAFPGVLYRADEEVASPLRAKHGSRRPRWYPKLSRSLTPGACICLAGIYPLAGPTIGIPDMANDPDEEITSALGLTWVTKTRMLSQAASFSV